LAIAGRAAACQAPYISDGELLYDESGLPE
jgi:hypothetical protein